MVLLGVLLKQIECTLTEARCFASCPIRIAICETAEEYLSCALEMQRGFAPKQAGRVQHARALAGRAGMAISVPHLPLPRDRSLMTHIVSGTSTSLHA